jgi:selenocysteine-specific elongation factor
LGGGRIIDAHPPRHRRLRETTLAELAREERGDPADLVGLALGRAAGRPLTADRVRQATMLSRPRTMNELEKAVKAGTAVAVGDGYYVDAKVFAAQARAAAAALEEFHQRFPLRAGMPKEELRSRVAPKWEAREFSLLLEKWQAEQRVRLVGQEVSLAGHDPAVTAEQERKLGALVDAFTRGGLMPPTLLEVEKELGLAPGPGEELVSRLVKEGRLVKVSEELYFGPEALTRAGEALREHFAAEKTLEASAFRDKLGVTRKYAIPLLEYFDRIRWTRRVADVRIAGPALLAKNA